MTSKCFIIRKIYSHEITGSRSHVCRIDITVTIIQRATGEAPDSLFAGMSDSPASSYPDSWSDGRDILAALGVAVAMMVEYGDIDGAEHGHDGATMIQEVLDFNDAVEVAYQFYLKHPDETLIVVTSDHETGGLSLNPHTPDQLALMQHQKISQESISSRLSRLIRQRQPEILSWEETKAFLTEYIGLWEKVPVSPEQEQLLRETYDITVAHKIPGSVKDLYADNALVVARAVRILNDNAQIHWTTEHSSGYVPTYVIGVGQEKFSAKMDNALIPKIIAEIAKYK